jgi:hypothetical protein
MNLFCANAAGAPESPAQMIPKAGSHWAQHAFPRGQRRAATGETKIIFINSSILPFLHAYFSYCWF